VDQFGVPQMSEMEASLARIRGKLLKKYQRDDGDGITYRYADGSTLRLTPFLIKEWSRAIVSDIYVIEFIICYIDNSFSMTWRLH